VAPVVPERTSSQITPAAGSSPTRTPRRCRSASPPGRGLGP
jgi:hypothetical protein